MYFPVTRCNAYSCFQNCTEMILQLQKKKMAEDGPSLHLVEKFENEKNVTGPFSWANRWYIQTQSWRHTWARDDDQDSKWIDGRHLNKVTLKKITFNRWPMLLLSSVLCKFEKRLVKSKSPSSYFFLFL